MNKYHLTRRSAEKRVAEIEAHYVKRVKMLDDTFAIGISSNSFSSASMSYGNM